MLSFYPLITGGMFATELVPHIDKRFRTIPSREARASIGTGYQVEKALVIAFSNPELIGKVATESLSTFFIERVDSLVKTAAQQPIEIFMEWGKYDLRNPNAAWDMAKVNRDFVQLLNERGFQVAGGERNEGTGWITWRNRTGAIFTALFPVHWGWQRGYLDAVGLP